jgi:hypothetical protein
VDCVSLSSDYIEKYSKYELKILMASMGINMRIILHTYSPMKKEQTECSETLAFKLQAPVNRPEEGVRQF